MSQISANPVWMYYLNSDLWQIDLDGELLSAVHIRVVRLLEGALEFVQLVRGERRAVPPVFLLDRVVRVVVVADVNVLQLPVTAVVVALLGPFP